MNKAFNAAKIGEEIKALHLEIVSLGRKSVQIALRAGRLLIEAKTALGHGKFGPWLKKTGVAERTARRYMALSKFTDGKTATLADLTLTEAYLQAGLLRNSDEALIDATDLMDAHAARTRKAVNGKAFPLVLSSSKHEDSVHNSFAAYVRQLDPNDLVRSLLDLADDPRFPEMVQRGLLLVFEAGKQKQPNLSSEGREPCQNHQQSISAREPAYPKD